MDFCTAAAAAAAKSLQSCLCDPIDGSPPGSSVPGILQARTVEWGAIAFSGISALIFVIFFCILWFQVEAEVIDIFF